MRLPRRHHRARRNDAGLAPQLDAAYEALRRLPSSPKVAPLVYAFEAELQDVPGSRYAARGASGSRPEAYLRGLLQAAQNTLNPPPVEPVVRLPATHRQWDASLVDTLKADIKRLVALYRSLYPPSSWKEGRLIEPEADVVRKWMHASHAFRDAVNNWETLVYHVLLGDKPDEQRNYEERQLAKAAWAFLNEIRPGHLFPTRWDYETERSDMLAPSRLVTDRDKAIRRIQTRGREFAKVLDEFFAGAGGTVERRPVLETYTVEGVRVVLYNRGRRPENDRDTRPYIRELREMMKPIQRAGFGWALDGLVVELRYESSGAAAGRYTLKDGHVLIYPMGMFAANAHTFIHEVGHRLYYRLLKPQAIHDWEAKIAVRTSHITDADIDLAASFIAEGEPGQSYNPFPRHEKDEKRILRELDALGIDEAQKYRIRYLLAQSYRMSFAKTKEQLVTKLREWSRGTPVMLEHFSDYGATKPEEAFAEAFADYVLHGPRALGPWTRAFFEEVVRPARQARDNPRRQARNPRRSLRR